MPNIKPISDLRNYTDVLNQVSYGNRVYLTRNGHGVYAILSMDELDELEKAIALGTLVGKLKAAENRAEKDGWIESDKAKILLGVVK